jgi:hypothetical protein
MGMHPLQLLVCGLEYRIDKIAVTQQTLITLEMNPHPAVLF